jgi:hypothetical protein
VTDPKRSRLAIGFEKGGKYTIGFASARAESSASMQAVLSGTTGKLSLAASLASSMRAEPIPVVARTFELTRHLGTQENCDEHHYVAKGKASWVSSRSILDSRESHQI